MIKGDFVAVLKGRGYKAAVIKHIDKQSVLVKYGDDTFEKIYKNNIIEGANFKEQCFLERMFHFEKNIHKNKEEQKMYCWKCGRRIKEHYSWCPHCGNEDNFKWNIINKEK